MCGVHTTRSGVPAFIDIDAIRTPAFKALKRKKKKKKKKKKKTELNQRPPQRHTRESGWPENPFGV